MGKEIVDSGLLIRSSYRFKNHERYDLNNGNSYLLQANDVYYGINVGATINIIQRGSKLLADWGNLPLVEVTKV